MSFIDAVGDMNPTSPGNKLGFYGATLLPYLPPSDPNAVINHATSNPLSFGVGELPIP